jgi:hypothetical protein
MIFEPRYLAEDRAIAMIADESVPSHSETEAPRPLQKAANENAEGAATPIDPRIVVIARTIGRQIAREQLDRLQAANDNGQEDEP